MYACVRVCDAMACMLRSKGNLKRLVLSFYQAGHRNQVGRFSNERLHLAATPHTPWKQGFTAAQAGPKFWMILLPYRLHLKWLTQVGPNSQTST